MPSNTSHSVYQAYGRLHGPDYGNGIVLARSPKCREISCVSYDRLVTDFVSEKAFQSIDEKKQVLGFWTKCGQDALLESDCSWYDVVVGPTSERRKGQDLFAPILITFAALEPTPLLQRSDCSADLGFMH